jgi:hypothetical protein
MLSSEQQKRAEELRSLNIKVAESWFGCPSLHHKHRESRFIIKAYQIMTCEEILISEAYEQQVVRRDANQKLRAINRQQEYQRRHPSKTRFCELVAA